MDRHEGSIRPPAVVPRPIVVGLVVVVATTLAAAGWLAALFGLAYGSLPFIAIGAVALGGSVVLLARKTESLGWLVFALFGVPAFVLVVLSRL